MEVSEKHLENNEKIKTTEVLEMAKSLKRSATELDETDKLKDRQQKQQLRPSLVAELTATATGAADIPIISLSDGEEDITTTGRNKVQQLYRLKRRKINVAGAPKMPLTGYVRYMNDRRDTLRREFPGKTAVEHTRIIGEEWHQLSEDSKAPYMKAAELDRQRYLDELDAFLKARPDILACELAKNKQRKSTDGNSAGNSAGNLSGSSKSVLKEKSSQINGNAKTASSSTATTKDAGKDKSRSNSDKDITPPPIAAAATTAQAQAVAQANTSAADKTQRRKRTPTPPAATNNASSNTLITPIPGEIPIFTNEFLEHNKIFDMELRTLRKSKADLEQQNAVLEKHVENMKFGVEKMTNENDELQEKNRLLEIYLDKLKHKLAQALAGLAIPTEPNGATIDNIDKYMNDLYKMATCNTHGPASLNKARDIIRKLDLQIQL